MATLTWLGNDPGNEGDWSVPANWGTSASVASIPVDGDNVVFGDNAQSVILGLDQNTVALNLLAFSDQYTGNIGADGTPLEIDAVVMTYAGKGLEAWIAGVFPKLDVNDAGFETGVRTNALHLSVTVTGKLTISGGRTITLDGALSSLGGSYSPTASVVGELIVQSRQIVQRPTVVIESGCTITAMRVSGGIVTCSSPVTTIDVDGGELTMDTGDVTLWRQNGGIGTWTPDGGTITALEARGGVFDASSNVDNKTISALWLYGGHSVKLNNTARTIVVTEVHDYSDGQGTFQVDPGAVATPDATG